MPGPEATASLPRDADTAYSSPPRAPPGPQPCPRGHQPQCPRDGGFSEVSGVLVEPWPTGSCPPTPCLQARPLECPHLAVTRGWAHRPFCPQPPTIPALQSPLSVDPMPARGLGAGSPFTDGDTEAQGQDRVSPAPWGHTDSNPGCVAGSRVLCLPINTHRDHSSHMGSCPALSKARGRCGHFPSEDQGSERPETPGTSRPPAPRLVHGQQALWGRARPQEETEGRRGPCSARQAGLPRPQPEPPLRAVPQLLQEA